MRFLDISLARSGLPTALSTTKLGHHVGSLPDSMLSAAWALLHVCARTPCAHDVLARHILVSACASVLVQMVWKKQASSSLIVSQCL